MTSFRQQEAVVSDDPSNKGQGTLGTKTDGPTPTSRAYTEITEGQNPPFDQKLERSTTDQEPKSGAEKLLEIAEKTTDLPTVAAAVELCTSRQIAQALLELAKENATLREKITALQKEGASQNKEMTNALINHFRTLAQD